jgi:hypothetical protein
MHHPPTPNDVFSVQIASTLRGSYVKLKEGLKLSAAYVFFLIVGACVGTGLDCWIHQSKYNKSTFNRGKISNLFAVVSVTLYFSIYAYTKRKNLGRRSWLALIPMAAYLLGCISMAHTVKPEQLWSALPKDQPSVWFASAVVTVIFMFMLYYKENTDQPNVPNVNPTTHAA